MSVNHAFGTGHQQMHAERTAGNALGDDFLNGAVQRDFMSLVVAGDQRTLDAGICRYVEKSTVVVSRAGFPVDSNEEKTRLRGTEACAGCWLGRFCNAIRDEERWPDYALGDPQRQS